MNASPLRLAAFAASALLFTGSLAAARQVQTAAPRNPATLAQLMRGVMFSNSNVIFASQSRKFDVIPDAKDPSSSTDPVTGTYGHWDAVENSSLAIVEAANLLEVPGRRCSNGRAVPTGNADWPKLVEGLRDAGMRSYQAARSKDRDKILDATEALTTACGNCHVKYRDTARLEDRCR